MPTSKNGAIELYYETFGLHEDPVVICLPGMGNQLLIYPEEFCMSLVDRGFFVIRMDNRDSGLSSATGDDDGYTLSDMADDTVAVLDAVGVETAVVLGLSLGGMIAQQLAVDHPERVRALVSLASTPGIGAEDLPQPTDEVAAALTAPPKDTVEEQIEADIVARKLWANPDWYDVEPLREFFTELHERAFVPGGGMRQFAAAMASPSRIDALKALDVPTLVVHGENDTLLPLEHGRRTAELIPGAEFLEIEGMSHDFVYQVWPPLVEAMTALTARTFS
ncbi:MAG: alpha/beta fold hydrolase [Actinomycetota bacterium]